MNELVKQESKMLAFDDTDFIGELVSTSESFCSMKAETQEDKAKLFTAMNNPDHRMADMVNMTAYIVDLYCEVVTCKREDGTETKCPRIVAIDKDGVSYNAVSLGIFSAFKKIIQIYGPPHWDEPIPVTFMQVSKGEKRMLTLKVGK